MSDAWDDDGTDDIAYSEGSGAGSGEGSEAGSGDGRMRDDTDAGSFDEAGSLDAADADDAALHVPTRRRKPYEVEYSSVHVRTLMQRQASELEQVQAILGLRAATCALLLRHFRWNKEMLLEQYMETPAAVLEKCGVGDPAATFTLGTAGAFECPICVEAGRLETAAASCGHTYCAKCYRRYVLGRIRDDGEASIKCPADKCKIQLEETFVRALVDDATGALYATMLLKAYVGSFDYLTWCAGQDCDEVVECHVKKTQLDTIVPSVMCSKAHKFCFGCGLDDHQPCVCALARKWLKKCEDDSQTGNWLSANTKDCPKCNSTTEKSGGCNHMTCKKCAYEYCWVCMGSWTEHGSNWYNCNRYDAKESSDARDAQMTSRLSLEKYLHYFNRYHNHQQSARLDQKMYTITEKKMEEIQQSSELSWIQVQFMRDALDELIKCRMTLKWTYAFAYFLARTNSSVLFEDNQRDLEMATEQLSELLEQPIEAGSIMVLKAKVLDKSVYVASRREILLCDTAQGLLETRWKYNADAE